MLPPEDIQWLNDRVDLTPIYQPVDPEAVERFNAYRDRYRKTQDAITEKLRVASEAAINPARRRRMKTRLAYLSNQPA